MEKKKLEGLVIIKDGKVTVVKNLSDWNAAVVPLGDPINVLAKLSTAGWKLGGDYKLKVYKEQEEQAS